MTSRATLVGLLLFCSSSVFAEDKPRKPSEDYGKNLEGDIASCRVICLDENDLVLFGGSFTVPFERPSVEQCGVWMSSSEAELASETAKRRKGADEDATRQSLRPREREELRRRAVEPVKQCAADFKRRCEELRTKVSLEERQKAVTTVEQEIERVLDEKKRVLIKKYLANVLKTCSLP